MENLQDLEIGILIDMLVKKTTSYTSKLVGRRVDLQQQEYEISRIIWELNSRPSLSGAGS
jgi:hypothetical protein